jgi:enterochelin esterase-like enzyme
MWRATTTMLAHTSFTSSTLNDASPSRSVRIVVNRSANVMKANFFSGGTLCIFSLALIALPPRSAFPGEPSAASPATQGDGDFVIGPDYELDPDLTDRGNPKGKYFEFSMRLADSRIFPGTDSTLDSKKPVRKERKIFVYVPAAYKDGVKAPILVTLDGPSRLNLVRNALDNLTISKDSARRLPAFIVIAVENGGNDGKGSERGLEYDTMSDRFARFIHEEVLPAVLSNAEIKAAYPRLAFTDDPWGRAGMGCSSGGAAVLTMGWFRPDLFRRLITYSGTFVDQQDDDAPEEADYPLGAWEYHSGMKLIENSEKKPLRIFTHVSENDLRPNDPEETHHNWVMANKRTAAALKAKGYDYRFVFSRGAKHCDSRVFEQTLADTLVWAWQGYRPE